MDAAPTRLPGMDNMSIFRFLFLPAFVFPHLLSICMAGEDPPQRARPANCVAEEELKDVNLVVRQQAATFDAMRQKTKPRFVWNQCDMLWIEHDEAGKAGFAMNRAYKDG